MINVIHYGGGVPVCIGMVAFRVTEEIQSARLPCIPNPNFFSLYRIRISKGSKSVSSGPHLVEIVRRQSTYYTPRRFWAFYTDY